MTRHFQRPLPLLSALALGAAVLLPVAASHAQQPEAPAAPAPQQNPFAYEIGHAAKTNNTYAVYATQPASSKLTGQKIRLKIVEITGLDRNTHYFTFATGKYKTVAQMDAVLVDVFRRFLASPPPVTGQELGKIGDVQHGGEVRFVVTSANILRFDNISPDQPVRASEFNRDDVAGLLAALTGPAPM